MTAVDGHRSMLRVGPFESQGDCFRIAEKFYDENGSCTKEGDA